MSLELYIILQFRQYLYDAKNFLLLLSIKIFKKLFNPISILLKKLNFINFSKIDIWYNYYYKSLIIIFKLINTLVPY